MGDESPGHAKASILDMYKSKLYICTHNMSKYPREKNKWTVSSARQNFPNLLAAAVREPQAIYRRKCLVAKVIEPSTASKLAEQRSDDKKRTVGAAFARLRAVCADEHYELPKALRRDRNNAFSRRLK
jgi:hypothetical protein